MSVTFTLKHDRAILKMYLHTKKYCQAAFACSKNKGSLHSTMVTSGYSKGKAISRPIITNTYKCLTVEYVSQWWKLIHYSRGKYVRRLLSTTDHCQPPYRSAIEVRHSETATTPPIGPLSRQIEVCHAACWLKWTCRRCNQWQIQDLQMWGQGRFFIF